jgi:uncharacterized small protein (DUF1192 family)
MSATEIGETLRRNRRELDRDPDSRSFREALFREHEKSVAKIADLFAEIRRAEAEADTAIFDLYEITAAQQAMVTAG